MVNAFLCLVLDVFGLAASVPSVHCSIWPFVADRRGQVQTNRVKCDVVDSKLRFNCVSTRLKAGQMVRLLLRLLQKARQCFTRAFVRYERTSATAGWRNNHVYEGISDAPRASACLSLTGF